MTRQRASATRWRCPPESVGRPALGRSQRGRRASSAASTVARCAPARARRRRAGRRRHSRRRSCAATAHRSGRRCRRCRSSGGTRSAGGGHDAVADRDLAAVDLIEAGDQAQQRRLAAAGRPEHGEEFAVARRRSKPGRARGTAPNALRDAVDRQSRHGSTPVRQAMARTAGSTSMRASSRRATVSVATRGGVGRIAALLEGEHDDAERLDAGRPEQRRDRQLVEGGEEDEQRAGGGGRRDQRQDDRAQAARAAARRPPARPLRAARSSWW